MGKLTDKQEQFCQQYLIDLNATQAAIRAGYSEKTARQIAEQNMSKLYIQKRIIELKSRREKRTNITQDRVLQELAIIGFAKVTDFLRVVESSVEEPKDYPIEDDDGENDESGLPKVTETKFFRGVEILETAKMPAEAIAAIASIKQGRSGIELKLHDKVRALELLARHLGMLNDKLTVNADEELKSLYKTVMSKRANA